MASNDWVSLHCSYRTQSSSTDNSTREDRQSASIGAETEETEEEMEENADLH